MTKSPVPAAMVSLVLAVTAQAGQAIFEATAPGQQFTAINTNGAAIAPRIIVRGWTTHRDSASPVFASGLKLNGMDIFPARMLTGGTWILNTNGTAQWGYQSGFWSKADDAPDDPRLLVIDPAKITLDHYPPLAPNYYGGYWMLYIARNGTPQDWTCRVQFPAGAVVTNFCISANDDAPSIAMPMARLYADTSMQALVAEQARDSGTGRFTFNHTPQLPNTFYLRITATNINPGATAVMYWMDCWAGLDATALPRMTLQPGTNTITVTDDAQSSHQWRVILEDPALADSTLPPVFTTPAEVATHRSRFRDHPLDPQQVVAPSNFFPLGVYAGVSTQTLDFVVDDVADLNGNVIFTTGMDIRMLESALDLVDRTSLKLIYQGGSSASLFYMDGYRYFAGSVAKEVAYNEACFKPAATNWVPQFVNRPGLLSWNLCEEVAPDVPGRLYTNGYYTLMRRLDPSHPPTFLHNTYEAAVNDLALNLPAAVTHDLYPFMLDPKAAPTTSAGSLAVTVAHARQYRQLCDAYDVPLWFMGQCWGVASEEQYTQPPFGRQAGARMLTAPLIRMQGWATVAEGARGLFFFLYRTSASGWEGVRSPHWQKNTNQWEGVKQVFGELKPLTPLLLRLKRTDTNDIRVEVSAPLMARTFGRRDMTVNGLYAVVVNTSTSSVIPLVVAGAAVKGAEVVWNFKRQQPVGSEGLEPGEGSLLWIGPRAQVDADQVYFGGSARPRWAKAWSKIRSLWHR